MLQDIYSTECLLTISTLKCLSEMVGYSICCSLVKNERSNFLTMCNVWESVKNYKTTLWRLSCTLLVRLFRNFLIVSYLLQTMKDYFLSWSSIQTFHHKNDLFSSFQTIQCHLPSKHEKTVRVRNARRVDN